jgi:hypothetical protein
MAKSGKGKRASGKSRTASGKARAASGRGEATTSKRKRVSGKGKAVSSRRSAKQARVDIVAAGTGAKVDIICRECHEEWTADIDAARAQDTITCPVCEHRARAPSDDILHQIKLYKGMETRNLKLAIGSVVVSIVSYLMWLVLTHDDRNAADAAIFYGPMALSIIALFATIFFAAKYERSRWETYF